MNEPTKIFINWMLEQCEDKCKTIKETQLPATSTKQSLIDYISPLNDWNSFMPPSEVERLWDSLRNYGISQIDFDMALNAIIEA